MAYNPNFKTVLLTKEQMAAVRNIQDAERHKSPYGIAPTLNAIVRGLLAQALAQHGSKAS
nr:hypothetical protein [Sodalis ligni]